MESEERVVVRKKIVYGLVAQSSALIFVLPTIQILSVKFGWSHHVLGLTGVGLSLLTIAIFFSAYRSILSRSAEIYTGLSTREKELTEKVNMLERDIGVYKQMTGFRSNLYSKIIFFSNILFLIAMTYGIFLLLAEGRPLIGSVHNIILIVFSYIMIVFSTIVNAISLFTTKGIEFCHCAKVNVGDKRNDKWIDITECGYFSNGMCPDCRKKLTNSIDKKLLFGNILCTMNIITPEVLDQAIQKQKEFRNKKLGAILIEMGTVTESDVNRAIQEQKRIIDHK